jgi:hypothetical protein
MSDKPYDTDIRYAMELWDEMKAACPGRIMSIARSGATHMILVSIDGITQAEDLTESQAICQAYIKFKEVGE